MSVTPGTRFGAYEVVEPLGSGGMGEVYRARDSRLRRDVALKVLPDRYRLDVDRQARFEREALALAALNHPNIATVLGVDEAGGVQALVMELVDGQTLADRIDRSALRTPVSARGPRTEGSGRGRSPSAVPLPEALAIARQLVDALEAAHQCGIVHRDLKPSNIKIRQDGVVKVLDFGLAKALDLGGRSTEVGASTISATAVHTVLGTPAYMSPEQARGQDVDQRADIWAFGCVLFEMLTGRRAFEGPTSSDVIAAVLDREPDFDQLPADTPFLVRRLMKRCLEKDPRRRLRDIADARMDLDEVEHVALGLAANPPLAPPGARARSNRAAIAAFSLAALAMAAAVGALVRPATGAVATPLRVSITFPGTHPLGDSDYVPFTLSSDGALLAYTTPQPERMILRRLDGFDVTRLAGTEGAFDPFFSPDHRWLGYWAFGQIKKVPVAGGPTVVVCEAADMLGASWGEDGSIVYAPGLNDGLFLVSDAGGTPQALTTLDPARNEIHHGFPQYVDGGRAVLFTAMARSKEAPHSVEIVETATGQRRTLVPGAQYGRYLSTGHLVFVRNRTLYATRVTAGTFVPVGEAVPVIEGLEAGMQGQALLSTAGNGTLMYVASGPQAQHSLVWVDRTGAATETGLPVRAYTAPRVSADGRTIAVTIVDADGSDLWTAAVGPGTLERLTFGRRTAWSFNSIAFSPDGAQLAYAEDGDGGARLMTQALDRRSAARELLLWKLAAGPSAWLPRGDGLFLSVRGAATGGDLLVLGAGRDAPWAPLVQQPGNQFGATPSADGRYVVYASDETGRFEVFVAPYPGPGERRQLTTDGGTEPVWSPKGNEIFFRQGDRMMSIPVTTAPTLVVGRPRMLFEGRFAAGAAGLPAYDAAADGRFLMLRQEREVAPRELRTILDWFTELNQKVP